jgi:hypothetical protein
MCSFVRARIARWASRSFARFLASWEGVRVDTLRVPGGAKVSQGEEAKARGNRLPFLLEVFAGSADGDLVAIFVEFWCECSLVGASADNVWCRRLASGHERDG